MKIKTSGDLLTASVIGWRWGQEKLDGRRSFFFFSRAFASLARCRIS